MHISSSTLHIQLSKHTSDQKNTNNKSCHNKFTHTHIYMYLPGEYWEETLTSKCLQVLNPNKSVEKFDKLGILHKESWELNPVHKTCYCAQGRLAERFRQRGLYKRHIYLLFTNPFPPVFKLESLPILLVFTKKNLVGKNRYSKKLEIKIEVMVNNMHDLYLPNFFCTL